MIDQRFLGRALLGAAIAISMAAACTGGSINGGGGSTAGVGGSGGAGACSGRACTLVEIAHVGYAIQQIVLDEDHVYWTGDHTIWVPTSSSAGSVPGGGLLASLPKAGGEPVKLLDTSYVAGSLSVDVSNLYWSEVYAMDAEGNVMLGDEAVDTMPKLGGTAAKLPLGGSNHPVVITSDATSLYVATREGAFLSLPKGGGPAVTLTTGVKLYGGMIVDDTNIYWIAAPPTNAEDGALMKMPKAGGTPVVLVSSKLIYRGPIQDDTSIFYMDYGGLQKVAKTGGAPVTLLAGSTNGITLDDTDVYLWDTDNLRKVSKGGGAATVVRPFEQGPFDNGDLVTTSAFVVDATSIYSVRVRKHAGKQDESWLFKMPK